MIPALPGQGVRSKSSRLVGDSVSYNRAVFGNYFYRNSHAHRLCVLSGVTFLCCVSFLFLSNEETGVPTSTVLQAARGSSHVLSIANCNYFCIGCLGVKLAGEGDAIARSSLRSQGFLSSFYQLSGPWIVHASDLRVGEEKPAPVCCCVT